MCKQTGRRAVNQESLHLTADEVALIMAVRKIASPECDVEIRLDKEGHYVVKKVIRRNVAV